MEALSERIAQIVVELLMNRLNKCLFTFSPVPDTAEMPSNPVPASNSEIPDSIIFTKKARQEGKIPTIIQSLQKSIIGRKDKTRAFVQEVHSWQQDGCIDAHFNARVMYDELNKLTPLTFGYEVFKKCYNNTI